VWCWGQNIFGLGDGSAATFSRVPVRVKGLQSAVGISVNGSVSCAVLVQGGAMCWGSNQQGRLGNGTTVNSPVPVPVSF